MPSINVQPGVSEPALLTVAEAALGLRVSAATVKRLCADGDLPAIRVGHQWRISADAITIPISERGARRTTNRLRNR